MATETAVEDTATYSPGLDASEVIRTFLQEAVHIGKPEPQASLQVALRNLRKIVSGTFRMDMDHIIAWKRDVSCNASSSMGFVGERGKLMGCYLLERE